jgi:hypothetical protein
MSDPQVDASVAALRSSIKTALDNIIAKVNTKLDQSNNFDNTGTGLTATDLAAAIVEIKGLIDALDATYQTDAQAAATIQAVNDAWAAADTSITNLVNNKLDASAYTAADVMAKVLANDGLGSGLDADLLGGIAADQYLTVNDTIDCGQI